MRLHKLQASTHLWAVNNTKNTKFMKAFGDNLRKLRTKKNISQETLAYKADIPISQIGRIERGEINTTISTVLTIANALEIDITALFSF